MLSSKDKKGLVLMVCVGVAVLVMLGVGLSFGNKKKPGADNCMGEVTANTVMLLDYSEQVPDQTLDEIVSRAMAHVRDRVTINERVSIFAVSELSKRSLKPIVSLCKPPNEGSRLTENVKRIKKRFTDEFEKPIRVALSRKPSDSPESPIAQALTDISLSYHLRGKSNTLLVFSDMIENTNKFSMYKCTSAQSTIASYRNSRAGAMERPKFTNTIVKLNIIPRLDQSREMLKCRDKFWPWFFGDNSGANAAMTLEYLPGGAPLPSAAHGDKK